MSKLNVVILAAGESTRMKSSTPKALHTLCGMPMVDYVLDAVKKTPAQRAAVVVNRKQVSFIDYLKTKKNVAIAFQEKPLGTADAVKAARKFFGKPNDTVLVMCVDTPLVRSQTLLALAEKHKESQAACTILTAAVENPFSFGRIVRDQYSKVTSIVEEADASFSQKQIKEINSGIYCFRANELLQSLAQVQLNQKKKEFYLTDIIKVLYEAGKTIQTFDCCDPDEILGINSQQDLSKASDIMRRRILDGFMSEGVRIISPETTFIDCGCVIGGDTTIKPFTVIESGVRIGQQCSIGPFCRLRKGSVVKDGTHIGNFSEINRSSLGKNCRMKHFGYLGDTTVGNAVNIGAGAVIANYDGKNKNQTVINDNSFIGCDTVIIAPAKIGKGAVTGAGSVVTRKSVVKDNSVVVGVPAKPIAKAEGPPKKPAVRAKEKHKKK